MTPDNQLDDDAIAPARETCREARFEDADAEALPFEPETSGNVGRHC